MGSKEDGDSILPVLQAGSGLLSLGSSSSDLTSMEGGCFFMIARVLPPLSCGPIECSWGGAGLCWWAGLCGTHVLSCSQLSPRNLCSLFSPVELQSVLSTSLMSPSFLSAFSLLSWAALGPDSCSIGIEE